MVVKTTGRYGEHQQKTFVVDSGLKWMSERGLGESVKKENLMEIFIQMMLNEVPRGCKKYLPM